MISVHWPSIKFSVQLKVFVITFRALHSQAPAYITSRSLKFCGQGLFVVPPSRLKTKWHFEILAPKPWISLPLRDIMDTFTEQLHTHLFRLVFVQSFFLFMLFLLFLSLCFRFALLLFFKSWSILWCMLLKGSITITYLFLLWRLNFVFSIPFNAQDNP